MAIQTQVTAVRRFKNFMPYVTNSYYNRSYVSMNLLTSTSTLILPRAEASRAGGVASVLGCVGLQTCLELVYR